MKPPTKSTFPEEPANPEKTSWIADELLGIRTLEQRLSRKLKSSDRQDTQYLLGHIQHLNWRLELLDRTLDEVNNEQSG